MHLSVNARDGGLRRKLGKLELRILEVRDGLTERPALAGVLDRPGDDRLGHQGGADRLRQPLLGELGHHVGEALPLSAHHVRGRHAHAVEEQL